MGNIISTVFKINTAFKPLVSGDPSKIFQDLNTYGRLVENVSKQKGIKNSKEPNMLINDLYFLDASR
jgi:hypothetical protein